MIRAGVLSDTHLSRPDSLFVRQVAACFADCDVIIHAGDLTALAVLEAFRGKTVYAVCGNMCDSGVSSCLPEQMQFSLGPFTIGLTHGARLGADRENALLNLFPDADCIIYGHTHRPVCQRCGPILFLNPGSFCPTGLYGAPGSFALLEAGEELAARIATVPAIR
ncbi:MAG: metallophosphoesterase [Desulfobulbus sp.]|jgi:putative phosphoesterase|uniref:metallophosphoesterase family protein n=1 Tax=Desulfobulbus sp. TaxID=895 RepID=UPI002850FB09|nr:metallophosphoesterase [Desulfobulbus sp.]MDR2550628.1 metallophosphoesterase [Desulfobulbus sp.]